VDREADTIRYLDAQYDYQHANPGTAANLIELFGGALDENDANYWRSILEILTDKGLILNACGMGGLGGLAGHLTARGLEFVEDARRRQRNPAERRKAATRLLLHWIDQQDQGNPSWMQIFPAFNAIRFLGDPLTQPELLGAAKRLADDGLIETHEGIAGLDGPDQVRIRPEGQRCVESGLDVDQYLARARRPEPPVQHTTWNVNGITGSAVVMGSQDFQQNVTNQSTSAAEVKLMLDAIFEAVKIMNLPAEQATAVIEQADVVRAEIGKPNADQAILRPAFQKIVDGLATGTQNTLSLVLPGLVQLWLIQHGMLLAPKN